MTKVLGWWLKLLVLLVLMAPETSVAASVRKSTKDSLPEIGSPASVDADFATMTKELNSIEEILKSETVESATISKYVAFLGDVRSRLQENKTRLDSELRNINRRIDSLGEMPKEGEEELPVIAEKRKEYNEEAVFQKGKIAENDLLMNRIDELTGLILVVRNRVLFGNLLVYQDPMIYPSNLLKTTGQFLDFCFDIVKSPVVWYSSLTDEQKKTVNSNILTVFFAIAAMLAIGYLLRRLIILHLGYKQNLTTPPPYFSKVLAAFFVACAYGVIPAVLLGSFLVWIIHTEILIAGFFGLVLSSMLYYALYIFLANAVIRVVLAPYNSMWRLANMEDAKARRITTTFYFSFFIIGVSNMLLHIATDANYTIELVYYLSLINSIIKASCVVLVVKRLFWEEDSVCSAEDEVGDDEDFADAKTRTAFRVIFLTSVFAVVVVGISLFGYPRLSEFIINRFLLSMLIICAFIVVRKSVFELLKRILLFNFWVKTLRVRRQLIEKLDFWLGVIVNPIFAVLTVLALLSLWGVSTDLLLQSMWKILFGFKVGGVEISLLSILLGIGVFFASLSLIKIMRRKLFDNILSHVEMDDGIRHSLASGFGYVGFVLAMFLAIAVMGGDLSNVALVAGALSVGIGLGLQNIVNNFVSGIILLFERPVKVGDWVIINNEEGRIKQINIRSTEVETFNKASVIIPNATLLSTSVTNLTHSNNWARRSVTVGVAYGTDPRKVTDILLECAKANKKVLKNPAPYVLFNNFGASSLEFELRAYTSDIWSGWSIPSELRYEIDRRFREEGIEIPFNQLVVHRGGEISEEAQTQFYARRQKKAAKAEANTDDKAADKTIEAKDKKNANQRSEK